MKDMYSSLFPNLKTRRVRTNLTSEAETLDRRRPSRNKSSLREVGQVLCDFSDEGERSRRAVIRVLLHQTEQGGRHDGRTQKPQEQGGADQALTDVRSPPVAALLSPRCKDLLQLSWKHTETGEGGL